MDNKLTTIISIMIIVYLAFAFVLWEFNPSNWEQVERGGCISISTTITIVVLSYKFLVEN